MGLSKSSVYQKDIHEYPDIIIFTLRDSRHCPLFCSEKKGFRHALFQIFSHQSIARKKGKDKKESPRSPRSPRASEADEEVVGSMKAAKNETTTADNFFWAVSRKCVQYACD